MPQKAKNTMSLEDITSFLDNFGVGNTKDEKSFMDAYHSAISKEDKEGYIESELNERGVNAGTELKVHRYTFDVDADPYLAEICPDGVSGHVLLSRFCGLFFVSNNQYGEGSEDFGPYPNLAQAKNAFNQMR
jgi:hypothetical protein